jgi:hypothetical protein
MRQQGYRSLAAWCIAVATFACTLAVAPPASDDSEWYAGIDVGSKGIKAVALPIDPSGKPDLHRTVSKLPHKAINNVTLKDLKDGKFRPAAIEDARAAVQDFYEQLTRGDEPKRPPIKPANIWIVASSGLVKDKPANFSELEQAVRDATGGANVLEQITARREMELLMRGAIPREQWENAIHVDVGSGNVKCGYIYPEHAPHVGRAYVADVDIEGTVSYRQTIEKEMKQGNAGESFRRYCKIAEERRENLARDVAGESGRNPGLFNPNRHRVYLSGGSPYVIASHLHPLEMANDSVTEVRFTIKELHEFIEKLQNTEKIPTRSLADLSETDRKLVEAQIRDVGDIFSDTKSLLAGAEILLGFNDALDWEKEKKEVFFTKSGLVAWIVGFVVEEKAKAARAAGLRPEGKD